MKRVKQAFDPHGILNPGKDLSVHDARRVVHCVIVASVLTAIACLLSDRPPPVRVRHQTALGEIEIEIDTSRGTDHRRELSEVRRRPACSTAAASIAPSGRTISRPRPVKIDGHPGSGQPRAAGGFSAAHPARDDQRHRPVAQGRHRVDGARGADTAATSSSSASAISRSSTSAASATRTVRASRRSAGRPRDGRRPQIQVGRRRGDADAADPIVRVRCVPCSSDIRESDVCRLCDRVSLPCCRCRSPIAARIRAQARDRSS